MNEDNSELLNNLINSIQEKMGPIQESNNTSTPDISGILGMLNQTDKKEENNTSTIDPNLLLKISKIMSSMNSSSPQKELLLSLKPFLRKSRQDKMSEYLMILNIISILNSFKDKGSD